MPKDEVVEAVISRAETTKTEIVAVKKERETEPPKKVRATAKFNIKSVANTPDRQRHAVLFTYEKGQIITDPFVIALCLKEKKPIVAV